MQRGRTIGIFHKSPFREWRQSPRYAASRYSITSVAATSNIGGAVMPSNLAVSFHPTALPAGKVSLICCARKSCQCGRADVHFSGSHYANGRHLTVRSIRWRFTVYRTAIARTRTRARSRQSEQPMKAHIKIAGALMIGVVLGGVSFSTLSAQTKAPAAYWVTEVLELQDQAAFMTAIQAVSPTVQQFGGRYIVLGGKLTADVGPVPKRITIIAFDSIDKAQGWLNDPRARSARDEVNKHAKTRAYTVEGTDQAAGPTAR